MPQLVSEITSGSGFSATASENSVAGSKSRAFRIILSSPDEAVSVEAACGVSVGSPHPADSTFTCTSYNANYEGESRMVLTVVFNYDPSPDQGGGGGGNQPPDSRPATWSLSSAIYERPVQVWRQRQTPNGWGNPKPATNPADDFYDGVTTLDAMVTISIRQFTLNDITRHCQFVGSINDEEIQLGSLQMKPHTVMLRGVQAEAVAIPYGDQIYRGFNATYEFAYRENKMEVSLEAAPAAELALGWDIAVPQTGFNAKAFTPQADDPVTRDPFGQPLKHADGRIGFEDGLPLLPQGITDGDKVRAMVLVYEYENGGASQTPSAMPIPLNDDGTPRKIDVAANSLPLVHSYQVHNSFNITNTLGLRLP